MNNTTISNLVTTTMADLEAGPLDQGTEKLKIRKQLRFIRDLYAKFPMAVVAGGCPMNHNYGVAAKDIDIFVPSEEIAQAILAEYSVVSYQLLGDSSRSEGVTYSETGYITIVHEAYVKFGRPSYTLHLNIIVLRNVHPVVSSRLALATDVVSNFPLVICKAYYSEVYNTLRLCRPYAPVPLFSNRNDSKEYKDRIMRKALLLTTQRWNSRFGTHYTPGASSLLISPSQYHMFNNGAVAALFRNYTFKNVNKDGGLSSYETSVKQLAQSHWLSGYDLLNVIHGNSYEEAARIYDEKRNATNRVNSQSRATLAQQAASLVSAMWPTSLTGSVVSRSLTSDGADPWRTMP